MGRRGPPPKPVELQIIEGNPSHRPINDDRPKPAPIAPRCPSWLSAAAKKEWRRVAPQLEDLGLLTQVDLSTLASYCQAWGRVQACSAIIAKQGLTFVSLKQFTENGAAFESLSIKPRPEVVMEQRYMAIARQCCLEFGMTPSARGRMTLPKQEDEDEDEEFLRGARGRGTA